MVGRPEPVTLRTTPQQRSSVDLYWIPLGAGGTGFLRLNGRMYEAISARRQRRRPLHLYHTALEVHVPEGRYVIKNAWPSPDAAAATRGVLVEGPVFGRRLARFRPFRYEVRCWRDGLIADAREAVTIHSISNEPTIAGELLDQVRSVPPITWGRDELGLGKMWNSNSVVSWLLTRIRIPMQTIAPPEGGRSPGWQAGIVAAGRGRTSPWVRSGSESTRRSTRR